MKYRKTFVSNSSVASYVVAGVHFSLEQDAFYRVAEYLDATDRFEYYAGTDYGLEDHELIVGETISYWNGDCVENAVYSMTISDLISLQKKLSDNGINGEFGVYTFIGLC